MNTGVDQLQREWSLLRPQIRASLLPQIRATYIVLCFTESKQAICSHRICNQRTIDLSSQPKYMLFFTIPCTDNHPLDFRVCQCSNNVESDFLNCFLCNAMIKLWSILRRQIIRVKTVIPGADPGFSLGGGALVSCSTSTPINHKVFFFFLAEYQLY